MCHKLLMLHCLKDPAKVPVSWLRIKQTIDMLSKVWGKVSMGFKKTWRALYLKRKKCKYYFVTVKLQPTVNSAFSPSPLFSSPKSSPPCPVTGKGQMMKVQVPAVVVQMQIRGTRQHQNLKSKKKENLLQPSRRKIPNYPAKLLLSYPLVLKGNNYKK